MKIFCRAKILEMVESHIMCKISAAEHIAAFQNKLRLFYAEILALLCPKKALQNAPEKFVVNALFGKPLRANGDCDVTETHLK